MRQIIAEIQTNAPDRAIDARLFLGVRIDCDPVRIGQLVSNLLGNAITYGAPERPILIEAYARDGWLEIAIANGGPPISEEAMRKIFQPFTRGAVRPNMQGLGLGLYIAHEIANAHNGELKVLSNAEETRFTFRMPLQIEEAIEATNTQDNCASLSSQN